MGIISWKIQILWLTSRPPTHKFVYFLGFDTYNFVYDIPNTSPIKVIIGESVDCDDINKMYVLFYYTII